MDTKLNNKFEMHTKVRVALISLNYVKIQFWLLHFGVTVNMVPTFWLLSISYRIPFNSGAKNDIKLKIIGTKLTTIKIVETKLAVTLK